MRESSFSLSKIYLPEDKVVVGRLKFFSFITVALAMVMSVVMIFVRPGLFVAATAFLIVSASILLNDKLDSFIINTKQTNKTLLFNIIFLICGILVFLIGTFLIFDNSVVDGKRVGLSVGLSLILISSALGTSRIKNANRFYFSNLLVFIILIINSVAFLGNIYQFLSPSRLHLTYMPFSYATILVLLCVSILLRWPGRGFVGIFTTDSISSKFSLRLLIVNLIVVSAFGIMILVIMKKETYSTFEVVAVLVILFMVSSVILSWINLKLLYRYELERFLMKEELRVRNITVSLDNEDLVNKMTDLEDRNKEIADKLSSRSKLMDIAENLP